MKKVLFLLIAITFAGSINAQSYKYWIEFTDKKGSPYSISKPLAYLSPRAIYRRSKYHIPVKMNDLPPNPAYIDSILSKGAILYNRCGWLNAISIGLADTSKLAIIKAFPFVKGTHLVVTKPGKPDKKLTYKFPHSAKKQLKPTAADTTKYGLAFSQIDMIKADCLNKKGFRGKGKQIAVIDTRFGMVDKLPAFDSLMKHKQILGTWDFVKEIPNVYNDSNNDTHGQLVLSCMASNLPGQLVGDAVDADYYLLRTEDIYSEYMIEDDNWASAAEYADSAGADIITTSLGYSVMQDQNNSYIYADMNGKTAVASIAATIAAEKGIVVCAAAGNDGSNHWHYICTPGDADSILTIGAVTATGDYANFSSKGPTYDGRIKPDVVARGSQVAVAGPYGGIISDEGTSFSAPTIAGAVAALWQADSTATNMQIINAIKQSASQYTHPDSLIGFGIPDFCKSLDILTKINGNKLGDETK